MARVSFFSSESWQPTHFLIGVFITDDLGTDGWGACPLHTLAPAQHGYPQTIDSTYLDKQNQGQIFQAGSVSFCFNSSFENGPSVVRIDPIVLQF